MSDNVTSESVGTSGCCAVWVKPTVENVVPYKQYRRTQPEMNLSLEQDQNASALDLLLGGGRNLVLSVMGGAVGSDGQNTECLDPVELFILNHCIVLWFDGLGHGIQIPYSSVLYHASRQVAYRNEGHKLEILLTLERDTVLDGLFPRSGHQIMVETGDTPPEFTMQSVELILTPKYSMYDRHYNTEIETLFTFANFGINRGDDLVNNCNEALAAGMEIYGEQQDREADQQYENYTPETSVETSVPPQGQANEPAAIYTGFQDALGSYAAFSNSGRADDLSNYTAEQLSHDADAGMSMQL